MLKLSFFSSDYVNNAEMLREAEEVDASLPEGLYEACLKTGRTPTSGDVKMVYYTKVALRLYPRVKYEMSQHTAGVLWP